MKHIKTYEDKLRYKAGDYILLKVNPEIGINEPEFANILSTDNSSVPYRCGWLKDDNDFWLDYSEIDRLLTPEEIEIYKSIVAAKKYNI